MPALGTGGWLGGGSPGKPADAAWAKSRPEWRTCRAASRCQQKTIPKLLAGGLARPCAHCFLQGRTRGAQAHLTSPEPLPHGSGPVQPAGLNRQARLSSVSWWGHGAQEEAQFTHMAGFPHRVPFSSLEKRSVRRPANDGLGVHFPHVHRRDPGQGTGQYVSPDTRPDLTLRAACDMPRTQLRYTQDTSGAHLWGTWGSPQYSLAGLALVGSRCSVPTVRERMTRK